MHATRLLSKKSWVLGAGALLATFVLAPYAGATTISIDLGSLTYFGAPAPTGQVSLTYATDDDANSAYVPTYTSGGPGTLSAYDPDGAYHITGATGTFSDPALGIINASIVGIKAINPSTPPQGETLPASFSWFGVGNSYDNLYYPNGSPLVCPPIPPHPWTFSGGFLDIYGVMLQLDHGGYVDLWSWGDVDGKIQGYPFGVSYGVKRVLPEPGLIWLFGAALLGLFGWRRWRETRKARTAG